MPETFESERLLFREIDYSDEEDLFELDSDPEVHRYLGNNPVQSRQRIKDVIAMINDQYYENGVGRMAVVLKETGEFVGWAGLKFVTYEMNGHINYYDLGYRFKKKHWGKGYATESAKAFVDYAFTAMGLLRIFTYTDATNSASRSILDKSGFKYIESFDDNGVLSAWYEILNPNLRKHEESI